MYLCIHIATNQQLRDTLRGRDPASLEMHFEAEIKWTESCTWRPWSIEFGDALGGRDGVHSEMHLNAMIDRGWRCTWGLRSSELRAALGGRDRSSLEMHLEDEIECTEMHWEAAIQRVWRCTCCRLWSSEIGGVLGGGRSGGGRWEARQVLRLY